MDCTQHFNSGNYQKPRNYLMYCQTSFFSSIKASTTILNAHMTELNLVVTMMKAIITLQRTILNCSEGIYDKDGFIDCTLSSFTSMSKEERDLTLMMELKRILWEVNVPSEYIKSLLQEKLNSESFIVEKQQYRRRQNLFLCYRGIQFLLERKFEIFINITLFQKVIFPMIKEMVMNEYFCQT